MINFRLPVSLLLLFVTLSCVSYGKMKVDNKALGGYGVNTSEFRVSLLSEKGDVLIGMERVKELSLRKDGKIYMVHVFKIDQKNDVVRSCKSIYLNLNSLDQFILSDSGDNLLILGNKGTQLWVLDTNSMVLKQIFKHEKGKEGFRAESIGMYYGGNYYIKGYFYDARQYSEGSCIAKIDITKTGLKAFEKVIDIDDVMRNLGAVNSFYLIAPDIGYFSVRKPEGGEVIISYNKGEVKELDKGRAITDMAGSDSRVIYTVMRDKNTSETILVDIKSLKKWSFGKSLPYSFISRNNGKTVVIADFELSNSKMNFSCARESDGFKLKPLLDDVDMGSFKLSGDGTTYIYLEPSGLTIGNF